MFLPFLLADGEFDVSRISSTSVSGIVARQTLRAQARDRSPVAIDTRGAAIRSSHQFRDLPGPDCGDALEQEVSGDGDVALFCGIIRVKGEIVGVCGRRECCGYQPICQSVTSRLH